MRTNELSCNIKWFSSHMEHGHDFSGFSLFLNKGILYSAFTALSIAAIRLGNCPDYCHMIQSRVHD